MSTPSTLPHRSGSGGSKLLVIEDCAKQTAAQSAGNEVCDPSSPFANNCVPEPDVQSLLMPWEHLNRIVLGLGTLVCLASCATPVVMLKNPQTGQVARCGGGTGGSVTGGLIGYSVEKDSDQNCVRDYEAQGFRRIP